MEMEAKERDEYKFFECGLNWGNIKIGVCFNVRQSLRKPTCCFQNNNRGRAIKANAFFTPLVYFSESLSS